MPTHFPVSMCVIEKALPSLEFVTVYVPEFNSLVFVSSSLSEKLTSSIKVYMFDSLEYIPTLSMIFTRSLIIASSKPVDIDVVVASSFLIPAGEGPSEAVLLRPHPPSPYDIN